MTILKMLRKVCGVAILLSTRSVFPLTRRASTGSPGLGQLERGVVAFFMSTLGFEQDMMKEGEPYLESTVDSYILTLISSP